MARKGKILFQLPPPPPNGKQIKIECLDSEKIPVHLINYYHFGCVKGWRLVHTHTHTHRNTHIYIYVADLSCGLKLAFHYQVPTMDGLHLKINYKFFSRGCVCLYLLGKKRSYSENTCQISNGGSHLQPLSLSLSLCLVSLN